MKNTSPDQAMMGDFPGAVEKTVIDSMNVHGDLAGQLLEDADKAAEFGKLLMELLLKGMAA